MSSILDNVYIWVFLVNSESVLLLCCTAIILKTVFFLYFLDAKNPCFVTKNYLKSSDICVVILSKKQHN